MKRYRLRELILLKFTYFLKTDNIGSIQSSARVEVQFSKNVRSVAQRSTLLKDIASFNMARCRARHVWHAFRFARGGRRGAAVRCAVSCACAGTARSAALALTRAVRGRAKCIMVVANKHQRDWYNWFRPHTSFIKIPHEHNLLFSFFIPDMFSRFCRLLVTEESLGLPNCRFFADINTTRCFYDTISVHAKNLCNDVECIMHITVLCVFWL